MCMQAKQGIPAEAFSPSWEWIHRLRHRYIITLFSVSECLPLWPRVHGDIVSLCWTEPCHWTQAKQFGLFGGPNDVNDTDVCLYDEPAQTMRLCFILSTGCWLDGSVLEQRYLPRGVTDGWIYLVLSPAKYLLPGWIWPHAVHAKECTIMSMCQCSSRNSYQNDGNTSFWRELVRNASFSKLLFWVNNDFLSYNFITSVVASVSF